MIIAAWIIIFFMTVVIHELSHGLVAHWYGDDTAKRAGRLTLNPIKHIDWFWTIAFPAMLFMSTGGRFAIGMAKPVPVNFWNLRRLREGMIAVAFAGPMANILLALLLRIVYSFYPHQMVLYAIYFNIGLAFFNLIPIPPLDGSRILAGLLPAKAANLMFRYEKYGYIVILLLYFTGVLFRIIVPPMNLFLGIMNLPLLGELIS